MYYPIEVEVTFMRADSPIDSWLFEVRRAPMYAVVKDQDGAILKIPVDTRHAIVAMDNQRVVGVVGRDYELFTNQDALNLCRQFCREAFPETKDSEWIFAAAYGPRSRRHVAMDLYHKASAVHLANGASEMFTPFVRVINSYDTSRAVRIDVGFIRGRCSNGMVLYESFAERVAAHTGEGINALRCDNPFAGMQSLISGFQEMISGLVTIPVTSSQGLHITKSVMRWPVLPENPSPRVLEDHRHLDQDLNERVDRYFDELGSNAYAVFNVMTDIAKRPPKSTRYRRDRPSLERIAGIWLKEFRRHSQSREFDVQDYINSLAAPKP